MSKRHARLTKQASRIKDEISALYERLDVITETLIKERFKENAHAQLVDNFSKRGQCIVYRTTSIRRFELKFK